MGSSPGSVPGLGPPRFWGWHAPGVGNPGLTNRLYVPGVFLVAGFGRHLGERVSSSATCRVGDPPGPYAIAEGKLGLRRHYGRR